MEIEIGKPDFWNDNHNAQLLVKEKNHIEKILNDYKSYKDELLNIKELVELNIKDNDENLTKELEVSLKNLQLKIREIELFCFLSKKNDELDVYVEIHAGAGGTESQDWAEMLRTMYSKWAEKKTFAFSWSFNMDYILLVFNKI